jgi:hypothetical protein
MRKIVFFFCSIVVFSNALAQKTIPKMAADGLASDVYRVESAGSVPLAGFIENLGDLPNVVPPANPPLSIRERDEEEESEGRIKNTIKNPNAYFGADLGLQKTRSSAATKAAISTIRNFDGTAFTGVNPPDVNGEVGLTHYVHTLNQPNSSYMVIYNKNTGVLEQTIDTQSAFWNSVTNATGIGDPVIIYDQLVNRWVYIEMNDDDNGATNEVLWAVSQTSNPRGAWYKYKLATPSFPDFPKISIWNGSILMTFNGGSADPKMYLINKSTLYAGTSLDFVQFSIPTITNVGFQPITCVDWDGNTAAAVNPMFMRIYDDAWAGSGGADHLELWSVNVNWSSPAGATITGPVNLNTTAFNSYFCASFNCTSQPGPGGTQLLDTQAEYINFRSQYRNFGTHESIVGSFAVNENGAGRAGIRWFELRRTVGNPNWVIHQQSTYAPADGANRFVTSIGIDAYGNMALGYNITNTTSNPVVYYSAATTGRLASDPLNQMTFDELRFAQGSQAMSTSTGGRTGDYYSVSVDPTDGRTFWVTSQYAKAGSTWGTKIASFSLQPVPTMVETATSGNWTIGATWIGGNIPDGTLPVKINNGHTVVVPNNVNAQAKGIDFAGGTVQFIGSGALKVNN